MEEGVLKAYIGKADTAMEEGQKGERRKLGDFLVFFEVATRQQWRALRIRGRVGSFVHRPGVCVRGLDYRNLRNFVEKVLPTGMPLRSVLVVHRILAPNSLSSPRK